MVYVLDYTGKAIMPTERHGNVRRLLRDGKAHVVRLEPFTIQLDYESKGYTQEVSLGVDAGSVHIGLSATTKKKELFAAEVILRTDIVELLSTRREQRHTRRARKTRYRAVRFNNRRKKESWLAPSVRNKIDTHLRVIRMINSILPIANTTIEVAQFDIQKIKNEKIRGVEYQDGEQMGFWNVREYVLARDDHKCQHCKGKSGDNILNVHHLESRKTGGNAPNNLITLCETCHKSYHRGEFELKVKRGTSFRDASFMNIMRWMVYEKTKCVFKNVFITFGYKTKHVRIKNNIEKTHIADARCISGNPKAKPMCFYYFCRRVRRHNRQIHKVNIKKGGMRKLNQAPYKMFGFRLFDKVKCEEKECFVFARRKSGKFDIRTIDGVRLYASKSYKKLKFLEERKSLIMTRIYD